MNRSSLPDYAERLRLQHLALGGHYRRWFGALSPDAEIRTIADIACGDGGFSRILSDVFPDAAITGLDVDPQYLEAAREASAEGCRIDYRQHDVLSGSLDETFDLVFCADSFQSIQDHQDLIEAMAAMTSDDGIVMITETDNVNDLVGGVPPEVELTLRQIELETLDNSARAGHCFPRDVVRHLRRAGLANVTLTSRTADFVGPLPNDLRRWLDRHFDDRLNALKDSGKDVPDDVAAYYDPTGERYFAAAENCIVTFLRYFAFATKKPAAEKSSAGNDRHGSD